MTILTNKLIFLSLSFFVLLSSQSNKRQNAFSGKHKNDSIYDVKREDRIKLTSVQENRNLGVVVLREDYHDEQLNIYNYDGSQWKSFKYTDDFSDNEIRPYAFKPENILLVFRCVGKIEQYYAVVVNEEKNVIKYIKQYGVFFKYETWEQHLVSIFSVDFDSKKNPIRLKPTEKAKQLPFNQEQFYHPIKVEGDWLMIKDDDKNEGWIKWRDNKGNLVISLYYYC